MTDNTEKKWANEAATNRVTVSKKAHNLRVSVKAPEFSMGNNFLTLCITMGVALEGLLIYLMINSAVSLALLVPGFVVLALGLGFGFVKLWLWHNFGEELINIKGNSFEMYRNYGLFKSDVNQLILNHDSELYTNRNDKWSWREFRGKGIFRLATVDANLTDFGLKLNDKEFEMIVRPISEMLDALKVQPEGIQFPTPQEKVEEATAPALSGSAERSRSKVEGKEETAEPEVQKEEEVQPPSLEEQTEGQHRSALNDYLEKAAGEDSSSEASEAEANKENNDKAKSS